MAAQFCLIGHDLDIVMIELFSCPISTSPKDLTAVDPEKIAIDSNTSTFYLNIVRVPSLSSLWMCNNIGGRRVKKAPLSCFWSDPCTRNRGFLYGLRPSYFNKGEMGVHIV